MSNQIITRFAPSPTGSLHIGGVRTALFSWVYSKQNNGKFILRIEDTDQERSTEDAVNIILDGMKWLGLESDIAPPRQMDRLSRYREIIDSLIKSKQAYICTCSKERLENLRAEQIKNNQKIGYDGCCRDKDLNLNQKNISYVIRFKNPLNGSVKWMDLVKGQMTIENNILDDFIIQRSDKIPTYNFAVVIDDLDMNISHVLRGDDHVSNTPKQLNLIDSLIKYNIITNTQKPQYGHVPMILGEDGQRLSKRHGAVSVLAYKKMGYLPEALLNYLIKLGWSDGDQEIFSIDEMIEKFNFRSISKSPARFQMDKLNWLNQHYLKTLPVENTALALKELAQLENIDISNGPKSEEIIPYYAERSKTLLDILNSSRYLYEDFSEFDPNAAKKHLRPVAQEPLEYFKSLIELDHFEWSKESLHQAILNTAEKLEIGMGKIGMPLRVAVTGAGQSPEIAPILFWLGKNKILNRLNKALDFISERIQAQ